MRVSRFAVTIGLAAVAMLGGAGVAGAVPAPPAHSAYDHGYRHAQVRDGYHHRGWVRHDHRGWNRYDHHRGWVRHDPRGWHRLHR
ncbi:hypothetical protein HCC61_25380 [Streptomyces sp. HNM0575]|uniref:hypothetical protein n=1 Tax=Streptomyces sp. HNM0575 TaxID=2716338 RepID=UPI00145F109A|nr:hypothetical protein [Streptomyces sp. HNM0575]NLU75943.1 hypothetical protein [Streptomyces sp. HNM0575]